MVASSNQYPKQGRDLDSGAESGEVVGSECALAPEERRQHSVRREVNRRFGCKAEYGQRGAPWAAPSAGIFATFAILLAHGQADLRGPPSGGLSSAKGHGRKPGVSPRKNVAGPNRFFKSHFGEPQAH